MGNWNFKVKFNFYQDLRKPDDFVSYYERNCNTNQRMTFDVNSSSKEIFLGNQDGSIISYIINSGQSNSYLQAHENCVNSIVIYQNKFNYDIILLINVLEVSFCLYLTV